MCCHKCARLPKSVVETLPVVMEHAQETDRGLVSLTALSTLLFVKFRYISRFCITFSGCFFGASALTINLFSFWGVQLRTVLDQYMFSLLVLMMC